MTDDSLFRMQQEAYERVRRRAEETRRLVEEQPLHAPSAREVRLQHERYSEPSSGNPPQRMAERIPPHMTEKSSPHAFEQPPSYRSVPRHEPPREPKPCAAHSKTRSPLSCLSDMEDDRLLVLLLALLLFRNGAQPELIFALLYIAMGE